MQGYSLIQQVGKRNIAALLILAILASVSYFVLNWLVEQQSGDANLINLSGKQRMLSQRIAQQSYVYVNQLYLNKEVTNTVNNLQSLTDEFIANQTYLSKQISANEHDELNKLQRLYNTSESSKLNLNQQVEAFAKNARALTSITEPSRAQLFIEQHFNQKSVSEILAHLDNAVTLLEQASQSRVEELHKYEMVNWLLTLILLLFFYIALFRPTENLIKRNYLSLLKAKNQSAEFQFAINKHAIVFKIDLKGKITYVNANFLAFYHYQEQDVIGMDVRLICADTYRKKDFANILQHCDKEEFWRGESLNKIKNGRVLWLETTLVPLKNVENQIVDFIVIQNDISEQKHIEFALNELHKITTNQHLNLDEKIQELLVLGTQLFHLPIAIVSHIENGIYTVLHCVAPDDGLLPGAQFPFEQTYCVHTFAANGPKGFHHVGESEIKSHPCYKNFGLESYIGIPLFVAGKRYGTLNFSSIEKSARPFSDREFRLVRLFGNWIGAAFTREQQRQKVLAQQQMMSEMSQQAKIGAWELDLMNRKLFWSPMTKAIHEVADTYQPTLERAIDFYHTDNDKAIIEKALDAAINDGTPINLECKLLTAKGNSIWIAVRGKADFEHGQCVRIFGSIQDISSRVASQEMIRVQKERLDFVMASTAVGIWDWEINTGKTVFNERWANIIGYSLSELEPVDVNTWLTYLHPEDKGLTQQQLEAHWRGEDEYYTCELRMKHKAGHWVWILSTGKSVEWHKDGTAKRMIGTHIDISEQKQVASEINSMNQRMTLAADSAGIGVWEYNVVTNELKWDPWMFKLYGISEANFSGAYEAWENGIHPDDAQRAVAELEQAINGGDKFDTQFRILWPNGEVRHIRAAAIVLFNEHDHAQSMIGVNYDITDRVNTETALTKAKQQAEAGAKAKSEFLASMSHEIRTPMNGVIGMLDLLQDTHLDQEQQQRVSIAQESAHSLLTLINDILDFSKIDAGKLELEQITFNLIHTVSSFARSMALQAQQKGLDLILDTTEVKQNFVIGDPNRIRQILINLVANAIKFTKEGEVLVTIEQIEHSSTHWQIVMTVKDTGIGIPRERQNKLFSAFQQLDASTTREFGGTGLGLAIVKRLCNEMAGDIDVESEPGKGSTFKCSILLEKSAEDVPSKPNLESLPRVLVIDNNKSNCAVIKKQFEQWGGTCYTMNTPKEALDFCQQLIASERPLFDLALIDVELAQIGDQHLVQLLDADSHFDDMQMVLMTPINMPSNLLSLMALNVHEQVTKPITSENLIQLLTSRSKEESVIEVDNTPAKLANHIDNQLNSSLNAHILLVEDNRINQAVAKGLLEKLGLTCDVANNGLEALNLLKSNNEGQHFDLILMDCQMPEMDGYQATQAIRAGEAGADFQYIPIVAMTANAMVGDKEKCLAAGMDEYVAKPIEQNKIISVLNSLLAKA